jgi:hypothetical protein
MTNIQVRMQKIERINKRMRLMMVGILTFAACAVMLAANSDSRNGADYHPNGVVIDLELESLGNALFYQDAHVFGTLEVWGDTLLNGLDVNGTINLSSIGGFNIQSDYVIDQSAVVLNVTSHAGQVNFINGHNGESFNIFQLDSTVQELTLIVKDLQAQLDECCGAVSSCTGDLDGDGEVKVADLLMLIGAWGVCP